MTDAELQDWALARSGSENLSRAPATVRRMHADLNAFNKEVLGRAAQYDLRLSGRVTMACQVVFAWHWHGRDLGRDFGSREQAIDWMVEWLATDAEEQRLPYLSQLPERTAH